VPSHYYICVFTLLHMCPHTTTYVPSNCYTCVLTLLYMCPHTCQVVAELIEDEFARLAANNITLSDLCASMRPEKKGKKEKKTRAPRYYVPKEEEGVPVINAWEFEDCQVVEGVGGGGGGLCVCVCVWGGGGRGILRLVGWCMGRGWRGGGMVGGMDERGIVYI
jgi:hypothetical protein